MTDQDLDPVAAAAWQESWDRQQEAYLPDREQRFAVMLDAVAAAADGRSPVIVDLAGGTGSISLRARHRFPAATTVLVDVDPVVTTIARASLDDRGSVVIADLRSPQWTERLPRRDVDAVLTATALHWIDEDRLAVLYREIRELLRPGGVFINADYMPDDGLPGFSQRLGAQGEARREARWAAGAVLSWSGWWDHVAADPVLGPLVPERKNVFAGWHASEFNPPASWHLDALRAAGFGEVGLIWRGGLDAAVIGVR